MNPLAEWLEVDGLGGIASGTVGGVRTRRSHAVLQAALRHGGRVVLVNGFDAWVDVPDGRRAISAQRYTPDVTHPDGTDRIVAFTHEPWPRWTYRLEDGIELVHDLFVVHGAPVVVVSWWLKTPRPDVRLTVRPFLSGRDPHAAHHENEILRFDAEVGEGRVAWHTYPALPRILSLSNGAYAHAPVWYHSFQYDEERARGLEFTEDLASPGELRWRLSDAPAVWILAADSPETEAVLGRATAGQCIARLRRTERARRLALEDPLHGAVGDAAARHGRSRPGIGA